MTSQSPHGLWVIPLTFFVGFYLAALPMGDFEMLRPDWLGVLFIFWALALPERFGIFSALVLGILYDILMGTPLGLYGAIYATLVYSVYLIHARLKMFPLGQQALCVFLLLGVTHVLVYWAKLSFTSLASGQLHIWPALASAVVWPWLFGLLRTLQFRMRVH